MNIGECSSISCVAQAIKSSLFNPVLSLLICVQLKHIFLEEHLPLLRDFSMGSFSVSYTMCNSPEHLVCGTQILIWIFLASAYSHLFFICSYSTKGDYAVAVHSWSGSLRNELSSPFAPLPWKGQQNTWSQLISLHSSVLWDEKRYVHNSKAM